MERSQTDRPRPVSLRWQRRHLGGSRRSRLALLRRPVRRDVVDLARASQDSRGRKRGPTLPCSHSKKERWCGTGRSCKKTAITCCRSTTKPAMIPKKWGRSTSLFLPSSRQSESGPRSARSGRKGEHSARRCRARRQHLIAYAAGAETTIPRRSATSSAPSRTTAAYVERRQRLAVSQPERGGRVPQAAKRPAAPDLQRQHEPPHAPDRGPLARSGPHLDVRRNIREGDGDFGYPSAFKPATADPPCLHVGGRTRRQPRGV